MGDLSDVPKQAWLTVVQATLSAEGYQRALQVWAADGQHLTLKFDTGYNVTATESGHGGR